MIADDAVSDSISLGTYCGFISIHCGVITLIIRYMRLICVCNSTALRYTRKQLPKWLRNTSLDMFVCDCSALSLAIEDVNLRKHYGMASTFETRIT